MVWVRCGGRSGNPGGNCLGNHATGAIAAAVFQSVGRVPGRSPIPDSSPVEQWGSPTTRPPQRAIAIKVRA
ncbi:hypothetical protein [Phormidium sp. CCY1219]|uniref:hypothetical protein n=1 Tax=Phormidium sp. CCY1219 TaxID=2886104 RepID=UPI002D1E7284|nr:hypothetical protein [Phormidium sp. CCY1219]MEB3831957.1 hypothetical protein [Phormidium sp. CCY1219]